jgi:hypothetical protein
MNDDMSRARSSSGADGSDARENPAPASATALRQALQGAVFPLSGAQLALVARENGAPAALLSLLGGLPRGDFRSLEAVESSLDAQTHTGSGDTRSPTASTQR